MGKVPVKGWYFLIMLSRGDQRSEQGNTGGEEKRRALGIPVWKARVRLMSTRLMVGSGVAPGLGALHYYAITHRDAQELSLLVDQNLREIGEDVQKWERKYKSSSLSTERLYIQEGHPTHTTSSQFLVSWYSFIGIECCLEHGPFPRKTASSPAKKQSTV
jgi:hypothetical protein